MRSLEYIGNCATLIDWFDVIAQLTNKSSFLITTDNIIEEHEEQAKLLFKNGYLNSDSIEWNNFIPNKDFNQSIVDKFSDFVSCTAVHVWISRVKQGKCVPYHYDMAYGDNDDFINQNKEKLVRFTCHMGSPEFGHVFATQNQCFYNQKNGDVFKWDSLDMIHGGANFGLVPKYLFNYIGMTNKC